MTNQKYKKKSGVVSDLTSGTGALIITVVIMLIIISTLLGANLLRSTAVTTIATDTEAWINTTTYTLDEYSSVNRNYDITYIANATGDINISSGNYTFTASTGTLVNASSASWDNVTIYYTYITPTEFENTANSLSGNYSSGINNVSNKLPTIFLLAAVVLLFGVLVVLVVQAKGSGMLNSKGASL